MSITVEDQAWQPMSWLTRLGMVWECTTTSTKIQVATDMATLLVEGPALESTASWIMSEAQTSGLLAQIIS